MAKVGLDYSAWTGPANDLKRRFDYQDPRTNSKIATIFLECKVEKGALGPITELSFMFSPFAVVDGMDLGLSIAPIDARHVPVGVRVLSADNRQGALMSPRTPQGSNLLLSHLLSGKQLKFGIFQGPEQLVDLPFYNDDEFAQLHRQASTPSPIVERKKHPKPEFDAVTEAEGFSVGEKVVYPAHGVGEILAIERQEIAGAKLELFVVNFIKDKMTLRVPTAKIVNVGMRKLSAPSTVSRALVHVADQPTGHWRRSFQPTEAEAKINSGDIFAIAEVVRELHPSILGYEPSYSERQLYEAALDRFAREIAAVRMIDEKEAVREIEAHVSQR